ncbi:MAG: dockerin type I repeat-containing protein, partial [Clostridia bacterium]|nr:dockerin type I repeat-containing protein [Clostridia bacterium]
MKRFGKWASAVLAGILLAVPAAASDILLGDVNVDGIVNRKDAMTLRRYWAGWEGYEYITAPSATDINQDGILNADDADAFSRYFAGDSTVGELVGQMVSAPLHYM